MNNLDFYEKGITFGGSFSYAWEQRKFIDIFNFERPDDYMVADDHYEESGIPVLTANKAFILGYKNETGAYNKGDCIIFDDFTLDSKYVDFPFKINSSAIKILTSNNKYNLKFAYYLLSSSNILMQGHARHYISIVQPYNIKVPDIDEQNKIEKFLSNIDNLITLHQRKYFERIFNNKIFNAKNTNTWEQRKVSELFNVTRGYVLAATLTTENQTKENQYPVYSSQTKDNGLMGYYSDYLYENAITWTTDGANAGTVRFRPKKFYCTNVCGVLLSEMGYANSMVAAALNNIAWRFVSRVGNPKLMNNVMKDIQIQLPLNISEQNKISTLLEQLDNLITLHQRE